MRMCFPHAGAWLPLSPETVRERMPRANRRLSTAPSRRHCLTGRQDSLYEDDPLYHAALRNQTPPAHTRRPGPPQVCPEESRMLKWKEQCRNCHRDCAAPPHRSPAPHGGEPPEFRQTKMHRVCRHMSQTPHPLLPDERPTDAMPRARSENPSQDHLCGLLRKVYGQSVCHAACRPDGAGSHGQADHDAPEMRWELRSKRHRAAATICGPCRQASD